MSWGHKRVAVTCVVFATVLVIAGKSTLAAVEELPFRQRVTDSIAVLKYLYKQKLGYADKLKMYQYNVNVTRTQFETIRALYEAELRQPAPDVLKLGRYEKSLTNLNEQFHQFSGPQYYETLKQLRALLEKSKARLETLPASTPAASTATEAPPAAPTAPAAPVAPVEAPKPAAAPAEAPPPAAGLEGAAAELEAPAPAAPAEAVPAPAEAAPTAAAAAPPETAPAQNEAQKAIAAMAKSIDGLKTKIDSYSAANFIDYEKMFSQRIAELDGQLNYYESVLNARVAEYHALFGKAPPVDLSYKAEIDRLHPATTLPGLLVLE